MVKSLKIWIFVFIYEETYCSEYMTKYYMFNDETRAPSIDPSPLTSDSFQNYLDDESRN